MQKMEKAMRIKTDRKSGRMNVAALLFIFIAAFINPSNALIESYDKYIFNDKITSYEFTNEGNPVLYINITGNTDAGQVNVAVDVSKDRSTPARITPRKTVYKFFNIWIGKFLFAEPRNIKKGEIIFRVENEWINSVHSNLITLNRIDANWSELLTQKIGEDDKYTYYRSYSQRFSTNFAITATNIGYEPEITFSHSSTNSNGPIDVHDPIKITNAIIIYPYQVYTQPDPENISNEDPTEGQKGENKRPVAQTSGIDLKLQIILIFIIVFLFEKRKKMFNR